MDQLRTLIAHYEEEQTKLQQLIDESLLDWDYLGAHHHSKALFQLNGRLQTLKNIEDKNYDRKKHTEDTIRYLEKQVETESDQHMKDYFSASLKHEREELEKLNQCPTPASSFENLGIFDQTFIDLLNGKIKNLKLILKKSDNLLLQFSYSQKVLKITLPFLKQHKKNYLIQDDKIRFFIRLGFQLVNNETKLVLKLNGTKADIIESAKEILPRIVFEAFYFKDFENESYIEFTEKK